MGSPGHVGQTMPFSGDDPISGGVILLQTEDDLGATVKKSIEAAGETLVGSVCTATRVPLSDDPEDLQLIQQVAKETGTKMLVADPCSEFFSKPLLNEKIIGNRFASSGRWRKASGWAVIFIRHFHQSGANPLYVGLAGSQ